MILAAAAAVVIVLSCIAWLILTELHALATGDIRFTIVSAVAFLILCAGYIGTGLWLRRTGRI